MAQDTVLRLYDFSGGLHVDKSPALLSANQLSHVDGFELEVEGALRKMRGFTPYSQESIGAGRILGMHRHLHEGVPQLLVAHGNKIYLGNDLDGTFTTVYGVQTPGLDTFFTTWKDKTFIVNGVDPVLQWDGVEVNFLLGAPSPFRFITVFSDRLWGVVEGDLVRYSELLDEDKWEDLETGIENLINVDPGDSQEITGIGATQTRLVLFKEYSIYYLRGYDPTEWVLEKITGDLGCIAPKSLVEMDGRLVWLSDRGVYLDDSRAFEMVSAPVQPLLDQCSLDQLRTAVGSRSKWRYRLDLPDHPSGPLRLEYDVRMKSWTSRTLPFQITSSTGFRAAGDTGDIVIGTSDGKVFYERGGSLEGKSFEAVARTRRFGLETPENILDLRRIIVDVSLDESDRGFFRWYLDGKSYPEGEYLLFSGKNYFSVRADQALGRDIMFEVSIEGETEGSLVTGLVADLRPRKGRWAF